MVEAMRFRRSLFMAAASTALLFLVAMGWVVLHPAGAIVRATGWFAPNLGLAIGSARWTSVRSLDFTDVSVRDLVKTPKATLRWSWRGLWRRHLSDLRLQGVQISVDLSELASIRSPPGPSVKTGAPPLPAWFLDRLLIERGGLVLVGVAPNLPPLSLEVDGEFRDVPLGSNTNSAERRRIRSVELRSLKIQSPVDFAYTLLYVEKLLVEFSLEGLERCELERLRIDHPRLDVDRGLFWFVDELRKGTTSATKKSVAAGQARWRTRKLEIAEGRLDITRLQEISLKYPLEFQLSQEDVDLESLSLASFRIELVIPEQNIFWPAMNLEFLHLGGKIAFNLGKGVEGGANDLVNTIHIEQVRWKDLPLDQAWLSFTFAQTIISGSFGGRFAKGYLNGGLSCGWSGDDPWAFWGAASDVEAGEICTAMASKHFQMNGRAELKFALKGQQAGLDGSLSLRSIEKGMMNIEAVDLAMEKIERNTEGMKREALKAFLGGLRDYPYDRYALDVNYRNPDATLTLRAESPRGKRSLDLRWHGISRKQEAVSGEQRAPTKSGPRTEVRVEK
jgi:hypothetical protein